MHFPSKQRVLVTGAGTGLGAAIAQRLLQDGHEVWATSRKIERLQGISGLHPIALDLFDQKSIQQAVAQAEKESGGIDALVNNAGGGYFGLLSTMSHEELMRQMQLLVTGPIHMIQQILPLMKQRGSGKIITITSLAGQFPIPCMAAYSAGKAALSAALVAIRLEESASGVNFIDLQPGDIRTEFNAAMATHPNWNNLERHLRNKIDHDMSVAPEPNCVADKVSEIIRRKNPARVVRVGDFFQSILAPALTRIVPKSWMEWGIKKYYNLDRSLTPR